MNIDESISKAALSLASVVVGWSLAQITGVIRDLLRTRKVRRCLIQELKDLLQECHRTKQIYARALQILSLKGIGDGVPSRLSNHIFRNFYKDAVLGLNSQQRISFQMIHTLVDGVNDGIAEVGKLAAELHRERHLRKSAVTGPVPIHEGS